MRPDIIGTRTHRSDPRPLTDDEAALVRFVLSAEPPATEPVPRLLSDALRRILESANPVDTLRHEFRSIAELSLRADIPRGPAPDDR